MATRLVQVCLFKEDGAALRRFCEVTSGQVEVDNGELLSFHMGGPTVAHHRPSGVLNEDDVLVTLQADSPAAVDRIYRQLVQSGLEIDDEPEDTDWGWRVFYFRAGEHLFFEVGSEIR
ncbi:MAG: hypothetical protein U1E65_18595 [Myxococcota bacterium]